MALLVSLLALPAVTALAVPASAGAYLYWANGGCCVATPSIGTIGRANNDGTYADESFINPPGNSSNLQGLSIDPNDIFWADAAAGTVGHANLDGSNATDDFIPDSRGTAGVASDSTYVFWSNAETQEIYRADLDGSNATPFVGVGGAPAGMSDVGGTLYYVDSDNATIYDTPVDTASPSSLLTVPAPPGGSQPNVQFVAVSGDYVYWTDLANNTIGRASLADPNNTADDAFITGASGPMGIAVDSSYVYWANSGQNGTTADNNNIGRANLDGTDVNQDFITGASVPYGLAVDDLGDTTTKVGCFPSSVGVDGSTTCTATVTNADTATPTAPSGTVSFASDGSGSFSNSGSCTLVNGSCSVSYTPTAVGSGSHTITASYGGDASHPTSQGQTPVTVTDTRMVITTTVSCAKPTATQLKQAKAGRQISIRCTAIAHRPAGARPSPLKPTGTVTFTASPGNDSGEGFSPTTCSLARARPTTEQCSTTFMTATPDHYTITAAYGGDQHYKPSSGHTSLTSQAAR